MDRQALRDVLDGFLDGKDSFDDALWLAGTGIVAVYQIGEALQANEPLQDVARRLDEAESELRAAKKLLGAVRGASPELLASVGRWHALAERMKALATP